MNNNPESCWNTIGVWGTRNSRCDKLANVTHCRNCNIYITAGRAVFSSHVSDDSENGLSEDQISPVTENPKPEHSVIVFRLNADWFALPVNIFSEILQARKIHRIPHMQEKHILGLSNVRGELKVCFSMESLLNQVENFPDYFGNCIETSRLFVTQINELTMVFPVSEAGDVIQFDDADFLDPDILAQEYLSDMFVGAIKKDDKTIGCISPASLYDSAKTSLPV